MTEQAPRYRAVVFDMDGLIFNSEDLYDRAGEQLLKRRGHCFDRQLKLEMMGKPGPVALRIMCDRLGIEETPECLQEELDVLFLDAVNASLQPMPGLWDLVARLEALELPRAIATSSGRRVAESMLGRFDLLKRFRFLLTGDDVMQGKPHPEIYLAAAERLGIRPGEMAVLEDSHAGSTAASRAGAFTVAVPNCHTADCDFSHADLVVHSLHDPALWKALGI